MITITSTCKGRSSGLSGDGDSLFVNAFGNGPNAVTVYEDSVTENVSIRINVSITGDVADSFIPRSFNFTYRLATVSGLHLNDETTIGLVLRAWATGEEQYWPQPQR